MNKGDSASDVNVVELVSVSKSFDLGSGSVGSLLSSLLGNKKSSFQNKISENPRFFYALDDVSLTLSKNTSLGIVGVNGAGKSTLLQIIAGTLKASSGTVEVNGRVASLLELGSGFDPNFTGRENVVLNASILGLSKSEIGDRMNSILDFAEIGDFIDKLVKTYSSGMILRLAFSVIAHVDADLLIIDEALAVGDAVFIQKCMRFIRDFKKRGTLLLVSHDIAAVQSLCSECIWLSGGKLIARGDTEATTRKYLSFVLSERNEDFCRESETSGRDLERAEGLESELYSGLATIKSVSFLELPELSVINCFAGGERVVLEIVAEVDGKVTCPVTGFILRNRLGQDLFSENTFGIKFDRGSLLSEKVNFKASFTFQMPILQKGSYSLSVAIAEVCEGGDFQQHHWIHEALIISSTSDSVFTGLVGIPMEAKSLSLEG